MTDESVVPNAAGREPSSQNFRVRPFPVRPFPGKCLSANSSAEKQRHPQDADALLLTDAQTPDRIEIALRIHIAEIIQKATTTADQCKQTSAARIVFLVRPHMFRQVVNPSRQDRNLDLRRAGVLLCMLKLSN